MNDEYKPEICIHCNQTITYLLPVDKGSVAIVKAIAAFIKAKGINVVHPRKEMEGTLLTSNQVGNLTRPRAHGLIAKIKGEKGNYCLTSKGAAFLRGKAIPKYAIRSKATLETVGYWREETEQVDVHSFSTEDDKWEGIGFTITEGRIIHNV